MPLKNSFLLPVAELWPLVLLLSPDRIGSRLPPRCAVVAEERTLGF